MQFPVLEYIGENRFMLLLRISTCPWSVIIYIDDVSLHTIMWSVFLGKRWTEFTEASPP